MAYIYVFFIIYSCLEGSKYTKQKFEYIFFSDF